MRRLMLVPLLLLGCQPSLAPSAPAGSPSPSAPPVVTTATPLPAASASSTAAAADGHSTVDAEKAACRLLGASGTPVRLAETPETAPVLLPDTHYAAELGAQGGFARLSVPKRAEWSLFLDREVVVILTAPDGAVVFDVGEPGASGVCPTIKRQRVYVLAPSRTYRLDFGAVDGGKLGLVIGETHPPH